MERMEIGILARSKAGHDKNKIYVITDADETYVYLADGKIRTKANPKKKKRKHVQLIYKQTDVNDMDDVEIKRSLKIFDKETEGE